jgi:hypothetical protein
LGAELGLEGVVQQIIEHAFDSNDEVGAWRRLMICGSDTAKGPSYVVNHSTIAGLTTSGRSR